MRIRMQNNSSYRIRIRFPYADQDTKLEKNSIPRIRIRIRFKSMRIRLHV
jgi:hypothetical protein